MAVALCVVKMVLEREPLGTRLKYRLAPRHKWGDVT
jgi:hypothetical protein